MSTPTAPQRVSQRNSLQRMLDSQACIEDRLDEQHEALNLLAHAVRQDRQARHEIRSLREQVRNLNEQAAALRRAISDRDRQIAARGTQIQRLTEENNRLRANQPFTIADLVAKADLPASPYQPPLPARHAFAHQFPRR